MSEGHGGMKQEVKEMMQGESREEPEEGAAPREVAGEPEEGEPRGCHRILTRGRQAMWRGKGKQEGERGEKQRANRERR